MEIDVERLKEIVAKRGFTGCSIAKEIGIDESTYYRKLKNGGKTFTIHQIKKLVDVLGITGTEAREIFFSLSLA